MHEILRRFLDAISGEIQTDTQGNFINGPVNPDTINTIIDTMVNNISYTDFRFDVEIPDSIRNLLNKINILYLFLDENGYQFAILIDEKLGYWKKEARIRLCMLYLRIMREITHLLQGGFASAALARVRAIYEIGVYIEIISDGDEELAKKFLLHYQAQNIKYAKSLKDDDKFLNKVLEKINSSYPDFDMEFWKDYQWARPLINSKKITFKNLADITAYSDQYNMYVNCCASTHATIYDCLFSIGLSKEERGKSVWITTPSENGIAEVARMMMVLSDKIIRRFFEPNSVSVFIVMILLSNIFKDLKDILGPTDPVNSSTQ